MFSLIRTSNQSLREKVCIILISHEKYCLLTAFMVPFGVFVIRVYKNAAVTITFYFFFLGVRLPVSKRQEKKNRKGE